MSEKALKSLADGVLKIGDTELDVSVLENGVRVVKQTDVFRALGRDPRGNSRIDQIPAFMDAKNLQSLISSDLQAVIKRVPYLDKNNKEKEGFNADILPLVADLYLKARDAGVLVATQIDTAKKAEMLIRSLARVGITALVDEATGYQYERERDELQKILKAYISEELLKWEKRFPDDFYKEIFRLNGWDFTVSGIKKRPGIIGKWTNTLIYNELPAGVLQELKENTPKHARYHQRLTPDIGQPNLTAQIYKVIGIMQSSDNMQEMWERFKKIKAREQDDSVEFDENGRIKE
ncbi:P63C domain-containing protein [Campylobacter sp. RM9344]|uniref:P63C domain-containing protein n=1 Tax=Campylobacter californiensis TaxID=1032243 RepID=A0AAW3ZXG8_9BACT|nr:MULTISPECIES: P63C domain-containing protein [unclassified Campylobacter]MBE2985327.1 P63C domain-containing protein [Campylobacter sp. RM6883]MBE2995860.1 P63C domain-containing protein [Campylobacter sp. RM6913]MBE3030297.1 P63C domain-containing protein [Campylobacter sp. RM9344]MBE3608743.1 P63C domain-containing protein [Campylobacter sp. RM9337]MBE3610519.1 P63C domain-containing protein [Campylobacter sp. RM12916]